MVFSEEFTLTSNVEGVPNIALLQPIAKNFIAQLPDTQLSCWFDSIKLSILSEDHLGHLYCALGTCNDAFVVPENRNCSKSLLRSFLASIITLFVAWHPQEIGSVMRASIAPFTETSPDMEIMRTVEHQSDPMDQQITPITSSQDVPPITPSEEAQHQVGSKNKKKKKNNKNKRKVESALDSSPDFTEDLVPLQPNPLPAPSSSSSTSNPSKISPSPSIPQQPLVGNSLASNSRDDMILDNSNIPNKKMKEKEVIDNTGHANLLITGYAPSPSEKEIMLDTVVYDIPAFWDNYTLLQHLAVWGKVISISTKVQKKYKTARIRLIPTTSCHDVFMRGDWAAPLGGIPVRWFPAKWSLAERKQREKFQAVIEKIPEAMTVASLFPDNTAHPFITESGLQSFKIVKEHDGTRKLIGYFATWEALSKRINNRQVWNDITLTWCRYSTPSFRQNIRSPQGQGGRTPATGTNNIPIRQRSNKSNNTKTKTTPPHNEEKKADKDTTSKKSKKSKHDKSDKKKSSHRSEKHLKKELIGGIKSFLEQLLTLAI